MRVGILTGGGDCPGLNAVIRAAVRKGIFHHNDEFVGFIEGWRGVVENKTRPLTLDTVSGILQLGGTILRTSRTNPRKMEGGIDKCLATIKANQLDALITIGGDDTQGVANALVQKGIKVVGVPKTIDNDLSGTDACFGFDTAVSIATEAIDRLHSTAEAHNRVIVCEVMGRDAGWIAITSGIAGGADVIFVPEKPIDIDQAVKILKERHDRGKLFSIVVVAEGAKLPGTDKQATKGAKVDAFGHARLSGIGRIHRRINRGENRLRNPLGKPGPHPARRNTHCVRPYARHSLWIGCNRFGARGKVRPACRAPRHRDYPHPARGCHRKNPNHR